MDARIDRVAPRNGSGCNTWLVGDGEEVIVVDPGSDAEAVLAAASDREIIAVICTHGHPGHVAAALEVAGRDEAPVALHRRDVLAWREAHLGREPDIEMEEGGVFEVAGVVLEVLLTPGHSPGSVSLYCEQLGVVFSGDALLATGPAPHAGAYPDFPGQLSAIGQELLTLPEQTRVLPGHGEEVTVETAGRRFDSWVVAGPQVGDPPA
ncbi:MAG TPA: MBL fold metallo-hydrolase [Streptosporangiaceae bacterium]|nr:MBL fold metallo-hydrolase [Streptosporangiaceae bacterium]